jgi:hypothetical protein
MIIDDIDQLEKDLSDPGDDPLVARPRCWRQTDQRDGAEMYAYHIVLAVRTGLSRSSGRSIVYGCGSGVYVGTSGRPLSGSRPTPESLSRLRSHA